MGRYVRIADKKAAETRAKLDAALQAVIDDPNASRGEKLAAAEKMADLVISDQRLEARTGPLKEEMAEKKTELNVLRAELATASAAATETQTKVAELAKQNADIAKEHEGCKADIIRLGDKIRILSTEKQSSLTAEAASRRELEVLKIAETKLRFTVATLAKHSNFSDGFIRELFFKFHGQLWPEVFIHLGWTQERLDQWAAFLKRVSSISNDILIERLHRNSNCVCRQQNPSIHPLPDDDAKFVESYLRFRDIDVEVEIGKLVEAHRQAWFDKVRVPLEYTPLSIAHRTITPLASGQVRQWGED